MPTALSTPIVDELTEVVHVLGTWQRDEAPLRLHPGDLGYFWSAGPDATAAAVRIWRDDGRIVGVGLLDSPNLLRFATSPDDDRDEELARTVAADVADPARGVLPIGAAGLEAPTGARVREVLDELGWIDDEPWTPLRRDLTGPVEDPGLRIDVVGPGNAADRVALQRASFDSSMFTVEKWEAMATGIAYAEARCLIARDEAGTPVAAVTVWSAGPGKPGLLEPLGVHREHRHRGYGRAITLAAAGALRELGSSSADVCTPSANAGAVATYAASGFRPLGERLDKARRAEQQLSTGA